LRLRTDIENKRRLRWSIALAAATALLAIYNISKSLNAVPSSMPAAPTSVAAPKKSRPLDPVRDTRLDLDALHFSQEKTPAIAGRNIFIMQNASTESQGKDANSSSGPIGPQPPA